LRKEDMAYGTRARTGNYFLFGYQINLFQKSSQEICLGLKAVKPIPILCKD
jgi:hypothetical protein